jgi:hypothetical protein
VEKENHRAGWRLRQIHRFLAKITKTTGSIEALSDFLTLKSSNLFTRCAMRGLFL